MKIVLDRFPPGCFFLRWSVVVSCPDVTHMRARGSGYTSPNSWTRFRIWKRPMKL